MNRHQALQDRLSAIETQLSLTTTGQALARSPRRHDAAHPVLPVLHALLAEVLPGAQVLDWRPNAGGHAGRMAADGLVYRFRVDGGGVAYRPAWDGVQQRGWELRSDSFLELRAPTARMDFRRGTGVTAGQKRRCSTGYGCGSACISLQKECRITPGSAIGKARLRRLQQLANAGDKAAGSTASQVSASRGAMAAERQKERNTARVEKLLARPEIAEYLRTGKLPQPASASTEPGTVRNMKAGEIAFDPGRFQYKLNATEGTGEVGSLSGVRRWDPNLSGVMSVWKDPADGKTYVVNGHNRLSLARRLGAEEVTVRFLDAKNATEARAIGALQNIAEGAGTPMDAAKFFRDSGIKTQADVEAKGLPLGSGQAEKGLKLSKLPGEVFNAVVRGDLSVNRGAIIGGSGLDEAKQREVFKEIRSRKGIADQTLQELVEHAAASVQRTQTTMNLFGESEEAKDNLITRARLSAAVKAKIAREKRLFSTVSKAKAASSLAEKGGNVINQQQSAKVASEAREALDVFQRLKSSSGPISASLNRAADRVEAGESEAKVRQELERDVFAAVEQELQSLGLRKRPRADSLQERIDALKRKCSTGYGCGSACISLRKECRSSPGSAMGKERLKRLMELAAGGSSSQRGIGTVKAKEAGDLVQGITARRSEKAAQLRTLRQISSDDPGMTPRAQRLLALAKQHLSGAAPSVLTNPGRQDPGLARKPAQPGLNAQDVTTSNQQAAFARQQQQAAKAAGDQRGAEAWRKEERTAERDRLANAITTGKQNQGSLFGVTEYDQTMPLFQQQAGATAQNQPRAQQRPAGGALVPTGRSAPAITPEVVNAEVLPARPGASRPGSIASTMRETLNAMKAADARQMGLMAEQLFETDWLLERRGRYKGKSKDQAREQYKVEFMQKLQEGARLPEAAARREAMGRRAAEAGSVSGAMRSLLDDMKASDDRLNDLTRQAIDLRVGAEEQFGGEGGGDFGLGGSRPRRRLGGSRRRRDAADDRFDDAIERLAVLRARMDQRCRRPDGSHYGTGGDCRQGIRAGIARAVGQRIKGLGRRLLGRGQKGPNGDVMASAERIQQMAAARKKEEAERQAKEKAREEELLSRGPQKWGVKQVEKEEVRGSGDKGIVWHESRYEVQLEEPLRLSARPGKEPRLVDKLSFQVAVDQANAKPIARKLGEQGINLSNGQVNKALELAWLTGAGGGEAFMGADRMELPKNVARRFAMEVSKQVKGLVSNMEEGQIVICKAHQDDGYGDKRRSLYERAGFTFIDGTGIAVVRNGKLGRIEGARGDRLDAGDEIDLEGLLFALLTLGSSRRRDAAADILEARIDALRLQCIPVAR